MTLRGDESALNPDRKKPLITFHKNWSMVTITGPGGFTQQPMREANADAVARALDIPIRKVRP